MPHNPGCEQEVDGIAVGGRMKGTYQYAPDKYAENILASKTPRKVLPALAHPVFSSAAETSARRYCSRTYYVWKEGEDH